MNFKTLKPCFSCCFTLRKRGRLPVSDQPPLNALTYKNLKPFSTLFDLSSTLIDNSILATTCNLISNKGFSYRPDNSPLFWYWSFLTSYWFSLDRVIAPWHLSFLLVEVWLCLRFYKKEFSLGKVITIQWIRSTLTTAQAEWYSVFKKENVECLNHRKAVLFNNNYFHIFLTKWGVGELLAQHLFFDSQGWFLFSIGNELMHLYR